MKKGIFIYQRPPSLFSSVMVGEGTHGVLGFKKGIKLREQFIEKTNDKLAGVAVVTADSTGANMEEVAAQHADFLICAPGLQKIVTSSKDLPPIIYTDLADFHKTEVIPTINEIRRILNS